MQEPEIKPFYYSLIPADSSKPLEQRFFDGNTDQELRDQLARYFATATLTSGQKDTFTKHMKTEIKKNSKKKDDSQVEEIDDDDDEKEKEKEKKPASAEEEAQLERMMQSSLDLNSCEIIPVIYPDATNGYLGMSLYIDQVGRFKELPLNERASKISQRDIRGDAFVLCNYDDPLQDKWERRDCKVEQVQACLDKPPTRALDPTARAQLMKSQMERKLVTSEDIDKAGKAKAEGNEFFGKKEYPKAIEKYSEALEVIDGRWQEREAEVKALHTACFSNRAECFLKLKKFNEAEADCTAALSEAPENIKALYRRALARKELNDFDNAKADIDRALKLAPTEPSLEALQKTVEVARKQHSKAMKSKFNKMFE
eukprot:Sspe_Gene.8342::Locus_2841_Transcript_1_1_Confidence_1.000_Length_1232::g.8342::m.8342